MHANASMFRFFLLKAHIIISAAIIATDDEHNVFVNVYKINQNLQSIVICVHYLHCIVMSTFITIKNWIWYHNLKEHITSVVITIFT